MKHEDWYSIRSGTFSIPKDLNRGLVCSRDFFVSNTLTLERAKLAEDSFPMTYFKSCSHDKKSSKNKSPCPLGLDPGGTIYPGSGGSLRDNSEK